MNEPKLTITDFIDLPDVTAAIKELREKFKTKPFIVSDVLDDQEHQYAHLVQKGGGVLGIALVGYTYVLEEMGIRFLKQAGTSAGAINTALMTVVDSKENAKSKKVLQAICDLEFFSLVDGHPVARFLIKKFLSDNQFLKKLKYWIIGLIGSLVFFLMADIILIGLQHRYNIGFFTGLSFILTGVCAMVIGITIAYIVTLMKRLKDAGFGINPGDTFYDWIKDHFKVNGILTVSQLKEKAAAPVPGMKLRMEHPQGLNDLEGTVTFITSELVTKNKIQFPLMCDLFAKKEEIDLKIQPAGFVRASMSIPVFFESYFIRDIPCTDDDVKAIWLERFGEKDPPSEVRFVDGGILSNFPMSLFYNPKAVVPRLPVFGIDLDDSEGGDDGKNAEGWSLAGYFGRMFGTLQNHSDKEFLLMHKVYGLGVGKVKVGGYQWLDFFMKNKQKLELFALGAQAAKDFLLRFDWDQYKNERADMQKILSPDKPQ